MPVRLTLVALVFLIAPAAAQQRSPGVLTPQIESILKSIRAADKGLLAVSEEDGRFLRVLVSTRGAKSVLEIGAASGYSGIWLGLGARESRGHGRLIAMTSCMRSVDFGDRQTTRWCRHQTAFWRSHKSKGDQ